ncbi:protein DML1, partial [Sporormia fimetaria CBS 119925]
ESYFTYAPEPESSVDHDVLFRPGIAPDGTDTFTPRALVYDLKGAFGTMKRVNALYESQSDSEFMDSALWPSKPIVQRREPIPSSSYQDALNAGLPLPSLSPSAVRYWSDYAHVYYHPKSLVQLSEFQVNDTLMPFESWDVGMELFSKLEREVDLVDRDLRPFMEECDGIQGLQILTGVDDAWGGWTSGWLERLRDEYGKMSIWTWGLGDQGGNPAVPRERRLQQMANSARSLNVLAEQSSVYVPMSNRPLTAPRYLQMDWTSPWHVGALHSAAFETMTMPSRLRSSEAGHGTLTVLEDAINSTGKRRVAKLAFSTADPDALAERSERQEDKGVNGASSKTQNGDADDSGVAEFDMDLFSREYRVPGKRQKEKTEHVFGRVETLRGNWGTPEGKSRDPHDWFGSGPALQRFTTSQLFPVLSSFPSIFELGDSRKDKLAVQAGLTTSTSVAGQIRTLDEIVRRLLDSDSREAMSNGLQSLAEEYEEGWSDDSDTDMDD